MKPEEQIQSEFEKIGFSLGAEFIKHLLPMHQRWQNYIKEAREIEVKEEDPAHVFCPKHW